MRERVIEVEEESRVVMQKAMGTREDVVKLTIHVPSLGSPLVPFQVM